MTDPLVAIASSLDRSCEGVFGIGPDSDSGWDALVGGLSTAPVLPTLPGYEILGELGRGGMGVVYRARERGLNRQVAVKMILDGEHAGATSALRIFAEAEAVARLSHPNIVQLHTVGICDGLPYVVLEYLAGGSLAAVLDGTPWPPRQAATLILTLARALETVHRLGIVHRDLKPANILLTADGTPKVSDFGLAKSLKTDSGLTRSDWIVGSPSYMAPEQARGRGAAVGPAADIHALGANLYELITGRPPFRGLTPLDTLDQVRNVQPVPPARLVPALPRDLETICLKCLQKAPERRYASAGELAADLERFLSGEPIKARRTPVWERGWMWAKRRPAAAALVVFSSAVALAATVTGLLYHQQHAAREAARQQRVAALRRHAEKALLLGRAALDRQDWTEASGRLASAAAVVRSEAGLRDLIGQTEFALRRCQAGIERESRRQKAQQRLAAFQRLHDEAVFHQSDYTGLAPETNLISTRDAARKALELAVAFETRSDPAAATEEVGAALTERQRAAVREDAYELFLILAATLLRPLEGEDPRALAREALALLDRSLHGHPPTRAYHRLRADALEVLEQPDAAAAQRRIAETIDDSGAVDQFLTAEEYFRNQEWTPAIEHFQRVLARKPEHFWASYLLAICHLKTQQPAAALAGLLTCQTARPEFVWIYLLKGFAEGELGEFDLAEADFQTALTLHADDEARYVLLVNRGVMRIRRGDPEAARADLEAAAALRPDRFQAHLNLAQLHHQMGRPDAARAAIEAGLRQAPRQPLLYRLRARLHDQDGDSTAALADLDTALRLSRPDDPQRSDDHLHRGRLLHRLNRRDEALAAYETALRLRPDALIARQLRGLALLETRRYTEAVQELDHCIRAGQATPLVLEARGLAQASLGRHQEAVADFTQAFRAGGNPAELLLRRGWSYLLLGAPRLAEADFDAVLRLAPDHAEAHLGRALAEVQLQRPEQALAAVRAARKLGPLDARSTYNAARVYAQLASHSGTCRRQALDLVHAALNALPPEDRSRFWTEVVRSDPALTSLRAVPEFLALESRFAPPAASAQAAKPDSEGERP